MIGVLWFNGVATEVAGGIGIVEVYRRLSVDAEGN